MGGPTASEQGEDILWTGHPDPRAHLTRSDLFLIPFSVCWLIFAIIWMISAVRGGASVVALVAGAVLTAFGIFLLVGRFVVKARTKRATTYVLTADRAIIRRPGREIVSELNPDEIRMTRSPWSSHVDIQFGRTYGRHGSALSSVVTGSYDNTGLDFAHASRAPFTFYDVADGEALRQALAAAGIDLRDRGAPVG